MPATAKAAAAPPQLSPERARLADAIDQVVRWEAWLDRLAREGTTKATAAFGAADRRVEAAKVALREASAMAARSAVSRLLGADTDTVDAVAQVRADLTDAEVALNQARLDSRALESEIDSARRELDVARAKRDEAVGDVLKATPAVAAMLAAWHASKARTAAIGAALNVVAPGLPNG
jgi:chromosome segregation ATPase